MVYYISFESVYSQGTGDIELITSKYENIDIFLNELDRYKKYLMDIDEDIENYEFYEYVYELDNIKIQPLKDNKVNVNGYCLWKQHYIGNQKINRNITSPNINEINIEKIELNEILEIDYVYLNMYNPPLKIKFENFDILGKNYIKNNFF